MKRLLILLVVLLVGGYGAAEVATKGYTERKIAATIEEKDPRTTNVDADVSIPLLVGLAANGSIRRVDVSVTDVTAAPLMVHRVVAVFHDVALDTGESLRRREPVVTSIRRLDVTAEISEENASKLLPPGFRVELGDGTLTLRGLGLAVEGTLTVSPPSSLVFEPAEGARLPLGIAVPVLRLQGVPYVTCVRHLEFRPGLLRLTCSIDNPPPRFPPATG
ncbi:MAG: LmeA family phospholipid-binding protein [Actinomycetota bacterium]